MDFVLSCDHWLPLPRISVFAFFSDAYRLEELTPPWLRFRVLTEPPIEMCRGRLIDYRLRLRGVPIRWRTEISAWEPPVRFEDSQLRGPYRKWVHEHLFEEVDGGTRVRDRVVYSVPGGSLVERLFVRGDVRRIFEYRQSRLPELLGLTPAECRSSGVQIRPFRCEAE
ncbi:MAG: SRPBCC family protein [Planctomycetota bacterium]|jgi:ligand-binding SRPBCC domain-containing protein